MYNDGKLWFSTTGETSKVNPSHYENIEACNISDDETNNSRISIKKFDPEEFTQVLKNCKKGYR